jgi:hypothetical protein
MLTDGTYRYNPKKTKCMTSGPNIFRSDPKWTLNSNVIEMVDSMEILGVHFGPGDSHANHRAQKCRRSFYGLSALGLPYPGCDVAVKRYLLQTICQPVLLYGAETNALSNPCLKNDEFHVQ